MSDTYVPPRYISGPEQAKMIRAALKASFPGIKFSVRCSRGSAVDIRWTDGPTGSDVDAVTQLYKGGGFDGMQDLRYSVQTILTTADGAEKVQFAQDFVFTHREYTDDFTLRVTAFIERHYSLPEAAGRLELNTRYDSWQCYGSDIFHRVACKTTRNDYGLAFPSRA